MSMELGSRKTVGISRSKERNVKLELYQGDYIRSDGMNYNTEQKVSEKKRSGTGDMTDRGN